MSLALETAEGYLPGYERGWKILSGSVGDSVNQGRIVVLEDEDDIREVIRYNLEKEGFVVSDFADGKAGLEAIRRGRPALVVLDLMLPGLDGLEICRALRANPATEDVPIVMLTAKCDESDVVLGLGLGADNYITKPFSAKELVARIKALLRRTSRTGKSPGRIERAGVVIDADRHLVTVDGRRSYLTATEFRLLHFLASSPGRVFTRDLLLSRISGENTFIVDRNIDVHVRSLRRKLMPYRDLVETIRGVGYRFRDDSP